jgi:hypothetical protein
MVVSRIVFHIGSVSVRGIEGLDRRRLARELEMALAERWTAVEPSEPASGSRRRVHAVVALPPRVDDAALSAVLAGAVVEAVRGRHESTRLGTGSSTRGGGRGRP